MKIELKDIVKNYDNVEAVKNVSFTALGKQIIGLVGRNGAGKTTLIKMLMGIIKPDAGKIEISYYDNENHKVGFLPEERGLYLNMTVKEQLLFIAMLNGLSKKEGLENIKYYLTQLGILEYLNTKVKKLSKGNKQKIQLISSLVHDPNLIILDEPFSGLDPINAKVLKNLLETLQSNGKTIILSSHRLEDIEQMCDYVIFLKKGEIIVQGDIQSVKSKYYYKNEFLLNVNKDIDNYLGKHTIKFEKINNNNYILESDSFSSIANLLKDVSDNEIEILKIEKRQVSLSDIFVKELNDESQENIIRI